MQEEAAKLSFIIKNDVKVIKEEDEDMEEEPIINFKLNLNALIESMLPEKEESS